MESELLISLLAIALLIGCSAFFSGSETALTAISRARIFRLVMDGNRRAEIVSKLRREKESLIGTILLGNTAVNVCVSALATTVTIQYLDENWVVATSVALTIALLIFGEVMPKTIAIQNSERFSLFVAPMVALLVKLFSPVTVTIRSFIRLLLRLFGVDITKSNTLISASDVIRGTIELHHREGEMVKQDRDMLGSILDLNDITVADVMVHRKQMETIDLGLPVEIIIRKAISSTHSRIPLWKDEPDNICGVLHVKNLVRAISEKSQLARADIEAILHTPWFIPESTNLRDQLLAFRQQRQHFALVVDEYGALLGIVTLEDIIEEIVGDIDDETDKRMPLNIRAVGDGAYVMDGTVTIRDLNRELDWNLPDEDASTIAGLLIHEARLIPEIGAAFDFHGYHFVVVDKKINQITRVRMKKLPVHAPGESADPAS